MNIERRRKIIFIPVRWIVTLLAGFKDSEFAKLPKISGLPESAINVGWYHDFARDAFVLVMQDESFEEVEEGIVLPSITVEWSMVYLPIAR